jgi:hypothetical protein
VNSKSLINAEVACDQIHLLFPPDLIALRYEGKYMLFCVTFFNFIEIKSIR